MTVGANPCWDVVIVGSGPAGSAAAIQLCERDRSMAARTLLLDRAQFPRHKLCGGGVVQRADELLGFLGVRVNVPSLPIHAVKFEHPGGTTIRRGLDLFRIVRREEFDDALVQAARALGVGDAAIMVRHLLPNAVAPILVTATIGVGSNIVAEAGLSFLGLGAQSPTISWGAMLADGQTFLATAPWVAVFPGLALLLAVLGVNLLGDGLRDLLDPRFRE